MISERTGQILVWEFRVRSGCEAEFEAAYGPEGKWVQLFRLGHGYLGTELLRDATDPRRYLTIDRWVSTEAFARFREVHGADYAALDALCEGWTEAEASIGAWIGLGSGSGS
ncbi:MAG: antibiotic biosynthesis monooxygenase family protein [Myxococcaceae bacterium]